MPRTAAPPIRHDLLGRTPYGAPQIDALVRLNTNENPYPPSPALAREIAAAAAAAAPPLNRYPGPRRDRAARATSPTYLGHGLRTDQVWAANGSNEIIQQLLQAFGGPGRTALGFEPSYSMHPIIARGTGTGGSTARARPTSALDPGGPPRRSASTGRTWCSSPRPNNPTGTAVPLDAIEASTPPRPGIVVVDEAYAEFAADGTPSALTLLPGRPRLVVSRTMSKAFAFAGARLGYLAADPAVVDALRLVRLPYHLSALTQAVAPRRAAPRRRAARHGRRRCGPSATHRGLAARAGGCTVADSDANFVLFGVFADRHAIWQGLLDRGVLIREVGPAGLAAGDRRHADGDGRVPRPR